MQYTKRVENWKSSADRIAVKDQKGFKICKSFCALLDFIHNEGWTGACHASSTVLFSLLAQQTIEADLCLGEVSCGKIYFDHSWIEIEGQIYDAAISNTLIENFYFPPVFRGVDLSTGEPTMLQYGTPSGQGYDGSALWIRSISVYEYMRTFPNHPQGLFGITKLVGKTAGIRVNTGAVKQRALTAVWEERP